MACESRALRRTGLKMVAAAALALLGIASAQAGGVMTTDCVYDHNGGYGHGTGARSCVRIWRDGPVNPYVIQVPQPQSKEEIAQAAEHERLWRARCHPVIRQDNNGVDRYVYAAPGCEYGRYQ